MSPFSIIPILNPIRRPNTGARIAATMLETTVCPSTTALPRARLRPARAAMKRHPAESGAGETARVIVIAMMTDSVEREFMSRVLSAMFHEAIVTFFSTNGHASSTMPRAMATATGPEPNSCTGKRVSNMLLFHTNAPTNRRLARIDTLSTRSSKKAICICDFLIGITAILYIAAAIRAHTTGAQTHETILTQARGQLIVPSAANCSPKREPMNA